MRYEIEPIEGQDAISVVYEEGYEGDKTLNDLNGKLMGTLYSPFAKRKIKKRLRDMEAYIKASGASVRDDESDSVSANGELPEESQSAAEDVYKRQAPIRSPVNRYRSRFYSIMQTKIKSIQIAGITPRNSVLAPERGGVFLLPDSN